jgi:hypothetical protein
VGTGENAVPVYASGSDGERPPVRVIQGPHARLLGPVALAFDRHGNLYVANGGCTWGACDGVSVYAPGASGDAAPVRASARSMNWDARCAGWGVLALLTSE